MSGNERAKAAGKVAGNVIVNKRSFSFFSVLTLILITLKILGYTEIGWGWIVACFFAPVLIVLAVLAIIFGAAILFIVVAGSIATGLDWYERRKRLDR